MALLKSAVTDSLLKACWRQSEYAEERIASFYVENAESAVQYICS